MTEPTAVTPAEAIEQVRAARLAAVQPFRDQLAQLDQLISETEKALAQLRVERRSLASVLAKIDSAMPKRRPRGRGISVSREAQNVERRERVVAVIEAIEQPFTAADVYRELKATENGGVVVGRGFANGEIRRLHDLGVLVIDAKIQGGGFTYRRLGSDG